MVAYRHSWIGVAVAYRHSWIGVAYQLVTHGLHCILFVPTASEDVFVLGTTTKVICKSNILRIVVLGKWGIS